jgi:hypothetical protein
MTSPQPVPLESSSRSRPAAPRQRGELWSTRMLGALRGVVAVVFLGDLAL